MKLKLLVLEDGIIATGFRKMAGFVERLHADTEVCYLSTNHIRSILNYVRGTYGGRGHLDADGIDDVARGLIDADVIGFSSMTGYAVLTKAIILRVRELSSDAYLVWGGIHPIMHPEDAIQTEVDAICTGEGEVAFEELYGHLRAGTDETGVKNFWFRRDGEVIRNGFLPLMTSEELAALPFQKYGGRECIYKHGRGFVPVSRSDYLKSNGLSYTAVWSIGCPFKCTYCGNTKFIENDPKYRRIRHPGARYIVDEIKEARRKIPHISSVQFQDDSFMAIPKRELREFAELWKEEVGVAFSVFGVIPNYVRRDKVEILTWAGMNRTRMGVQSGSKRILEFYKRPSPPAKVEAAGEILASFAPRYHMPPTYDIIMDNPIETRQDVVDTLEMLYRMQRPFTLLLYSLKLIPNTELERAMKELGVDVEEISDNYFVFPPRWANLMLYVIAVVRPPRWLWDRMISRVRASGEEQQEHRFLGAILRIVYLVTRAFSHLRFMDFSNITGYPGWICWKLGIVSLWQRLFIRPFPVPEEEPPLTDPGNHLALGVTVHPPAPSQLGPTA